LAWPYRVGQTNSRNADTTQSSDPLVRIDTPIW
jgi:hypothetical protein